MFYGLIFESLSSNTDLQNQKLCNAIASKAIYFEKHNTEKIVSYTFFEYKSG